MLPLAERLKRSHLFTKAYSARKSVSTPLFTLYVLPRLSRVKSTEQSSAEKTRSLDGSTRIEKERLPMTGFVVSKKASKSACRRNRMKRRIRDAYRKIRTESLNQWYVMILVVKESVLNAHWADLCRTMEAAFSEAAQKHGRRQ